jgi:hypothetical protein
MKADDDEDGGQDDAELVPLVADAMKALRQHDLARIEMRARPPDDLDGRADDEGGTEGRDQADDRLAATEPAKENAIHHDREEDRGRHRGQDAQPERQGELHIDQEADIAPKVMRSPCAKLAKPSIPKVSVTPTAPSAMIEPRSVP